MSDTVDYVNEDSATRGVPVLLMIDIACALALGFSDSGLLK